MLLAKAFSISELQCDTFIHSYVWKQGTQEAAKPSLETLLISLWLAHKKSSILTYIRHCCQLCSTNYAMKTRTYSLFQIITLDHWTCWWTAPPSALPTLPNVCSGHSTLGFHKASIFHLDSFSRQDPSTPALWAMTRFQTFCGWTVCCGAHLTPLSFYPATGHLGWQWLFWIV